MEYAVLSSYTVSYIFILIDYLFKEGRDITQTIVSYKISRGGYMELRKIIYEQFNELNRKVRTANFYKVDLHIHTPGSRQDYMVGGRKYEKVNKETLEEIARAKGLFDNPKFIELYRNKDELMALLIIHEAYTVKELNLIAITDHDNMSWFKKIAEANVKYRCNIATVPRKFEVLPGVEITCFNGTHIIAIFEVDNYEKVWEYIKYDLNGLGEAGHKIFTYKSEMDVVQTIRRAKGIVYIPHLDNNAQKTKIKDMLTPLNGVSKVEILISKYVDAIGFTNYEYKDIVRETLENRNSVYYRDTPVAYLKDSDAHCIEEIGHNFMYIKMDRPSFNSLRFALKDPEHRVKEKINDKVEIPFVRGMVIKGVFLSKPSVEFTYYPFSKNLNCIIGKGGSGKSIILNFIVSCLKEKAINLTIKKQIQECELILIYIRYYNEDYCIACNPCVDNNWDFKDDNLDISKWIKGYKLQESKFRTLTNEELLKFLRSFSVFYFAQSELAALIERSNCEEIFKELALRCNFRYNLNFEKLNEVLKDKIKIKYNIESGELRNISILVNTNKRTGKQSKYIYREFKDLSTGQKTVAVTTLIMEFIKTSNNHIPIFIDEPECNLNGKYIYEEFVKYIQDIKEQNQIIFITQNANIPVVGDAENIMVMDVSYVRSWLEVYGSLDNNKIKARVIDELEGGQDSFKTRMSKYNFL